MKLTGIVLIVIEISFVNCGSINDICGRRSGVVGTIFGGNSVKKHSWPWIAAFYDRTVDTFFCAGSLFSTKHVLSGR